MVEAVHSARVSLMSLARIVDPDGDLDEDLDPDLDLHALIS